MDAFTLLIIDAGMSKHEASKYLNRSETTIRRWCVNNNPPFWATEALALRAGQAKHWEGFKFCDGYIINPNGDTVKKNIIASIEYYGYLQRHIGWSAAEKCYKQPPTEESENYDLTNITPLFSSSEDCA